MRLKKLPFIMMVFTAVFLIGSVASAENWCWYQCDISRLGIGGGRYEFKISGTKMHDFQTGPETINSWFEIHPEAIQLQKEVLAVVLTAVSLGKKVEILVIPGTTKSIYAIYLVM